MPIESHHILVTVEAPRQWRAKGIEFFCRYDLVKFSANGSPIYNCIFIHDGTEKILVPEKARGDGIVRERELTFFPGLFNLHQKFGDGTQLLLQDDYTIKTIRVVNNAIEPVMQGLDKTESEAS